MERERAWLYNGDGWRLDVKRYWDRARLDPSKRPVLFIPGYFNRRTARLIGMDGVFARV